MNPVALTVCTVSPTAAYAGMPAKPAAKSDAIAIVRLAIITFLLSVLVVIE